MEKFKKYLEKNGIAYRVDSYNENYFFNAPALHFTGVTISCGKNDEMNGVLPETTTKAILRYCARFGYTIVDQTHSYGVTTYRVMVGKEWDAIHLYNEYAMASVNCCACFDHNKRETTGNMATNEELKDIMRDYGELYNKARTHAQKVA